MVYVSVSREEHDYLLRLANRDAITLAQFIRDCINNQLAEEDEHATLLAVPARLSTRRRQPFEPSDQPKINVADKATQGNTA